MILLERNPFFWSAPFSNKWLIDVVDTGFLVHDMQRPANKYGYTLIQCDVTGIERDRKVVRTSKGNVDYDFLILSGGIRDAWDVWFGDDQAAIDHTRAHYASAYIPQGQMLGLKDKVRNFQGGTIVMTLPPPPHRCPPSPYERACLMAWHFKTNNIPAKIVIGLLVALQFDQPPGPVLVLVSGTITALALITDGAAGRRSRTS